jgi:hypothetical protein
MKTTSGFAGWTVDGVHPASRRAGRLSAPPSADRRWPGERCRRFLRQPNAPYPRTHRTSRSLCPTALGCDCTELYAPLWREAANFQFLEGASAATVQIHFPPAESRENLEGDRFELVVPRFVVGGRLADAIAECAASRRLRRARKQRAAYRPHRLYGHPVTHDLSGEKASGFACAIRLRSSPSPDRISTGPRCGTRANDLAATLESRTC